MGSKAFGQEKQKAFVFAQQYIRAHNRPQFLPLTQLNEGTENASFLAALPRG